MPNPCGTTIDEMKVLLHRAGVGFSEDRSGGLMIDGGPDDYLIEVDPVRGLRCLFGVDMEELRLLVSGSSNEDLGEDELQRVAREHLRPLFRRYQPIFASAGFEERVEVDPESYAIAFAKSIDGVSSTDVVEWVQWCRRAGRSGGD